MGEYENPALLSAEPTSGQVAVFNATTGRWDPTAVAAVGALVVPQAHEAATGAPAALTAAAVTATDATSPAGVGYVQADQTALADLANSLKVELNAAVADAVALRTELGTLTTAHNTLVAALQTAGVLAAV